VNLTFDFLNQNLAHYVYANFVLNNFLFGNLGALTGLLDRQMQCGIGLKRRFLCFIVFLGGVVGFANLEILVFQKLNFNKIFHY